MLDLIFNCEFWMFTKLFDSGSGGDCADDRSGLLKCQQTRRRFSTLRRNVYRSGNTVLDRRIRSGYRPCHGTVLSRYVESLFEHTRKSFPWGNFSDGGLNQSIKRRLSLWDFEVIDWLIDEKSTLTWLVYWIRTAWFVFTGAGLKRPQHNGIAAVQKWRHASFFGALPSLDRF